MKKSAVINLYDESSSETFFPPVFDKENKLQIRLSEIFPGRIRTQSSQRSDFSFFLLLALHNN